MLLSRYNQCMSLDQKMIYFTNQSVKYRDWVLTQILGEKTEDKNQWKS